MSLHDTLKALSDPVRRDILELLKHGQLSAGDIGKHFELSAATISHHLSQLKKAGLIVESKYKNFIYYELNASVRQMDLYQKKLEYGQLHFFYLRFI